MSEHRHGFRLDDIYFRESLADWHETFGDRSGERLRDTALLLFTPDALVSGQVAAGYGLLRAAGFTAAAATPVRLTRHVCREVWRRDILDMPPDRLAVCDRLLSLTDSLAVLLIDERPQAGLAAAERLSRMKGSGVFRSRRKGTLRASLSSPNSMFRLVHTSDGPRELVREMGVLWDSGRRRALLRGLRAGEAVDPATLVGLADEAVRPVGARPLTTLEPVRRAVALVRDALRSSPGDRALTLLARHLDTIAAGEEVPCRLLYTVIEETGLAVDPWDAVAVGVRSVCSGMLDAAPEQAAPS